MDAPHLAQALAQAGTWGAACLGRARRPLSCYRRTAPADDPTAAPMGHPRDGAIPPQARQPRSCHKVSEQEPARLRQGRRPYKPHPSLNGAKKKAPQRPATPGRRFPRSKIAGEDGRPKETSGWPHVAARRDGGAQRLRHSDRLVRSAGCPRYPLGTLEPGHA